MVPGIDFWESEKKIGGQESKRQKEADLIKLLKARMKNKKVDIEFPYGSTKRPSLPW